MSAEQSKCWRKESNKMSSTTRKSLMSSLTLALVNVVIFVGSQPLYIQTMLVSCLNPLLVASMAFLGTLFLHERILGVPIGFCIVAVVAMLLMYLLHKKYDPFAKEKAVDTSTVMPILSKAPALITAGNLRHDRRASRLSDGVSGPSSKGK